MLHVTNGDSAREWIEALGLPGRVLAWRDVLHEGPVPADLSAEELRRVRAHFLAEAGWAVEDEALRELEARDSELRAAAQVVLWFEHDLYDQLQLVQVLDLLANGEAVVELAQSGRHLIELTPPELRALYDSRVRIGSEHFESAGRAWLAFRSPDPTSLAELVLQGTPSLPFLAPALRRHLQQFPCVEDGLTRTERQVLEAVAGGARDREAVFEAASRREEAAFMGDTSFWRALDRLAPLLVDEGGRLRLAPAAEAVLDGRADGSSVLASDRWLGGVHLEGPAPAWRWDESAGAVVSAR